MTNFTTSALRSMMQAGLDFANQFDAASGAIVNNVTIRNTLFLNKVINVMGYSYLKEHRWTLDHLPLHKSPIRISRFSSPCTGKGSSITSLTQLINSASQS